MNSKILKRIIIKYFSDELSLDERNLLKKWLKNTENRELFDKIARDDFDLNLMYSKVNSEKSFEEIDRLVTKKGKQITFIPNVFKYAAAIIILAVSGYFLTQNEFTPKQEIVKIENDIPVVTDKAILTLDDGSNIVLEEGEKYENEKVVANGEKVTYRSSNVTPVEEITYNYLTVPRRGEFFIELEDGTKVWLNADSKLKYPVKFIDGQIRQVELLYGEAYFAVSPSTKHHGDGFKVKKGNQEIEVLGTEFNIKAYDDENEMETVLVEGRVALNINDISNELVPNQQLVYNKDTDSIKVEEVDAQSETSWRFGIFKFDGKSFSEVSKTLSRWYDVEFIFLNEEAKNLKIDGALSKYKNIERFLITLKNTNNIHYKIEENKIYIK